DAARVAGIFLRTLRRAAGMTQARWMAALDAKAADMAKQPALSVTTIQRWESGRQLPDGEATTVIMAYADEKGLFPIPAEGAPRRRCPQPRIRHRRTPRVRHRGWPTGMQGRASDRVAEH